MKGEGGDRLPLAPAAPGPRRCAAPLPPAAALQAALPTPSSYLWPSLLPAHPLGPPPRPAHHTVAPRLGPQRPAAAGGGAVGTRAGGVPRPWFAAHSRMGGPCPFHAGHRLPRDHLCRVGARGAAVRWGFLGRVARRFIRGKGESGGKPSLNPWPSGYFNVPVVHFTVDAQWK